jgi:hypothetical protein
MILVALIAADIAIGRALFVRDPMVLARVAPIGILSQVSLYAALRLRQARSFWTGFTSCGAALIVGWLSCLFFPGSWAGQAFGNAFASYNPLAERLIYLLPGPIVQGVLFGDGEWGGLNLDVAVISLVMLPPQLLFSLVGGLLGSGIFAAQRKLANRRRTSPPLLPSDGLEP